MSVATFTVSRVSPVVNYRCITAHTSSNGSATLGKPGLGSTGSLKSWSTYWEVASLYYIRESLIAGTTYTDVNLGVSSKSIVEVARAWIRAGFAPRNPLYFKTGHDGNTPGAVPFNFNFFFDRFIRRRTSNDVEQSTPAWRDILDTSRRTRLRKAA